MHIFAQIDQSLLSYTGVIATVLSVIFGVAAFYNSRTRKKHIIELEKAQKQENRMHFRPAKSTSTVSRPAVSTRSTPPHQSSNVHGADRVSSSAPKAAPVAKSFQDSDIPSVEPKEKSEPHSPKEPAPFFRKVRPSGSSSDNSEYEKHDKENYIWE